MSSCSALHIIEEVSKKNSSIVSVANIFSSYEKLNDSKIITYSSDRALKKKIIILKNLISLFIYRSSIFNILKKYSPKVLHIHGLWQPIQFFFIYYAKLLNIPVILQPHGMLLPEALKSKSIISFFLKSIIVMIYVFLCREAVIIAVTIEEKNFIRKYFKKNKIVILPNPFYSTFKISKKTNKQISFFGRMNKHKNLELIIRAFEKANLDKKWKLVIYGIPDDLQYENYLRGYVIKKRLNHKIFFKKPIFSIKHKFKKISESFCNILFSKSEVLSLSVLESLSVGVKSLVNNNIYYPKKIKRLIYLSKPNTNLISNQLNKITKTYNARKIERQKYLIRKSFLNLYSFEKIKYLYINTVKKIKKKKLLNLNIFHIGITNIFNNFYIAYLLVALSIFNKSEISAEIGITASLAYFLTQIFSMNARALLLNKAFAEDKYLKYFLNIRIFISIFLTIVFICITSFYYLEHAYLVNILFFLVIVSWINEINLVLIEIEKHKIFLKIHLIILAIFFILTTYALFISIILLQKITLILLIYQFLILIYFMGLEFKFSIINSTKEINSIIFNGFYSTFFNNIAIISWRLSIIYLLDKSLSGIIFAFLSIASFPGTLVNNILGQSIFRDNKIKKLIENKKIFIPILFGSIFILLFFLKIILKDDLIIPDASFANNRYFINGLSISLIGTMFMIFATLSRHKLISEYKNLKEIFAKDILYSIIISPIIFILYFFYKIDGILYCYLFSSFLAFLIYRK